MKNNAYPVHPICTEADYRAALQLVAPYFDKEPELDSDAGAHFEAMLTLIEAYEVRHYPRDPPDPWAPSNSAWSSMASSRKIWSF